MKHREPDIEELYNKYCKQLYAISLRIVGNSFEAEEIMHDTFIKYHIFAHKNQILELDKWLFSVCIRKSIDQLRSRNSYINGVAKYSNNTKNQEHINQETEPEDITLQDHNNRQAYEVDLIKIALESLDDQSRMVLSLHLFEGYDYAEISQITGIKENSLRSIYNRSRAKLHQATQKMTRIAK